MTTSPPAQHEDANVSLTVIPTDQILNEDCFVVAADLPDQSVDVVITDPPYPNRMDLFGDTLVDGLAGLYLSCKKARKHVIFFWSPFNIPQPPRGWYVNAQHIWHKPDAKSKITYETITVWGRENRLDRCKVWQVPILDYRSLRDWHPHPTQKPVRLLRYLVQDYTNEGDLVFDPFVGSGSTAVACKQLGRHWLGVEIDATYAGIAQKRLQDRNIRAEEPGTSTPETETPSRRALPELPDDGLQAVEEALDESDSLPRAVVPDETEEDEIETSLPASQESPGPREAQPEAPYVSARQRPPTARSRTGRQVRPRPSAEPSASSTASHRSR